MSITLKLIIWIFIFQVIGYKKYTDTHAVPKKWKTYQHEDFSFQYPNDWKIYESSFLWNKDQIVQIAPKKKLEKLYKINKPNSNPIQYYWVMKDVLLMRKKCGNLLKIVDKTAFSEVNIVVYKEFSPDSLSIEDIVLERRERMAKDKIKGYFKKIAPNHYINFFKTEVYKSCCNNNASLNKPEKTKTGKYQNDTNQFTEVHIIKEKNAVYYIAYTALVKQEKDPFLDTGHAIIKTFKLNHEE